MMPRDVDLKLYLEKINITSPNLKSNLELSSFKEGKVFYWRGGG